jgi:hypothetical protein
MSDDPTPTPSSGNIKITGHAPKIDVGVDDNWTQPTFDEIQTMSLKDLSHRIHTLIELARRIGRGEANSPGGLPVVIFTAQFLRDELARREQDRQTRTMISQTETVKKYTWWMTVMTVVIMGVALWDHLPAFHTLPPPASLPAPGPS